MLLIGVINTNLLKTPGQDFRKSGVARGEMGRKKVGSLARHHCMNMFLRPNLSTPGLLRYNHLHLSSNPTEFLIIAILYGPISPGYKQTTIITRSLNGQVVMENGFKSKRNSESTTYFDIQINSLYSLPLSFTPPPPPSRKEGQVNGSNPLLQNIAEAIRPMVKS